MQFWKLLFKKPQPSVKEFNVSRIQKFKKGVNTPISKNFKSSEFDCHCKLPECKWTLIDLEHVKKLQEKRDKLGRSIKINSAYRCAEHNKLVGGATNSQHVQGIATDIVVEGMTPDEVAKEMEDSFNGLGKYDTFTHVDSRGTYARWDYRKVK